MVQKGLEQLSLLLLQQCSSNSAISQDPIIISVQPQLGPHACTTRPSSPYTLFLPDARLLLCVSPPWAAGIMVEQFVVDGPHARLYDHSSGSWVKLMNWQHSTMYLFFGIAGFANVIATSLKSMPLGIDRMSISLALFVEGMV